MTNYLLPFRLSLTDATVQMRKNVSAHLDNLFTEVYKHFQKNRQYWDNEAGGEQLGHRLALRERNKYMRRVLEEAKPSIPQGTALLKYGTPYKQLRTVVV